jgi:hypothetical protein
VEVSIRQLYLLCNVLALHHPYITIVLRIAEVGAADTHGAAYDVFPPRLQEHDLHNVIGAASVHELHASLLRAYTVVQLQRLALEQLEYISSIRDQHTW